MNIDCDMPPLTKGDEEGFLKYRLFIVDPNHISGLLLISAMTANR